MTRVRLEIVTMAGNQYVLYDQDGAPAFPSGELQEGESPAEAARRIVLASTGTKAPKLEMVDMLATPGELTLLLRAMLIDEPQGAPRRFDRMALPTKVGKLDGKYVEDAIKTSLAYKLTRV